MASDTSSYRRHLPHLRRDGATYFLTWVLACRETPLEPAGRTIVLETIRHFEGIRYTLHAAVVMDDHVHVLVTPLPGIDLSKVVHTWKSYSAHQIVRGGRSSPVWLDEYRDSIIRGGPHLAVAIDYIRQNPRRRWPHLVEYQWLYIPDPASGRPSL